MRFVETAELHPARIITSTANEVFTITEKVPTRAFSWLKAPISTFTFNFLLSEISTLTPPPQDCLYLEENTMLKGLKPKVSRCASRPFQPAEGEAFSVIAKL